jgi:hypothetical protein
MIKSVTTGLCILALSGGLAFAQSSQGQAGADTGPTSPTSKMMKRSPMNANARMMKKKHHMHHSMKSDMSKSDMSKSGMSKGSMSNDMSGGMKKDNMMDKGSK